MITITVDSSTIQSTLKQLQARLGNLSPAMNSIGQTMESRVRGRFETRIDPNRKAWSPWKESTRKSYPLSGKPEAVKYGAGNGRLLDRCQSFFKRGHGLIW